MKNAILTTLFILFVASLMAQNYREMATDPSGDLAGPYSPDVKSFSMDVDSVQDKIWLKIEAYDSIIGDWGFVVLFDTNSVPGDGKSWISEHNAQNSSMTFDRKLVILNNKFFPPTHAILSDTSGQWFSQDITITRPDSFTVEVQLKWSEVDNDTRMNVVVGASDFTGMVYDEIPDNSFVSYEAQLLTIIDPTTPEGFMVYPNPTSNYLNFRSDQPIVSLELINLLGEVMLEQQSGERIETGSLSNGIYLLRYHLGSGQQGVQQIIIH